MMGDASRTKVCSTVYAERAERAAMWRGAVNVMQRVTALARMPAAAAAVVTVQ